MRGQVPNLSSHDDRSYGKLESAKEIAGQRKPEWFYSLY